MAKLDFNANESSGLVRSSEGMTLAVPHFVAFAIRVFDAAGEATLACLGAGADFCPDRGLVPHALQDKARSRHINTSTEELFCFTSVCQ